MKRIGLAAALALILGGCPKSDVADDFSGTWTGTITETYTCAQSSPPAFTLQEELDITQDSAGDVSITVNSCSGVSLDGTASGDTVNVSASGTTTFSCSQSDGAGDTITVDDFSGGTLTLSDANDLQVDLSEDATVNGDDCTGDATGTLTSQ